MKRWPALVMVAVLQLFIACSSGSEGRTTQSPSPTEVLAPDQVDTGREETSNSAGSSAILGDTYNEAHEACVEQSPMFTHATVVELTATCVQELLDERQRRCVKDAAREMRDLPGPITDTQKRLPVFSLSAEPTDALIPVEVAETIANVNPAVDVVPVVREFDSAFLREGAPLSDQALEAFLVLATNWSALERQQIPAGSPQPDDGEFILSNNYPNLESLVVGASYSIIGPHVDAKFVFAGSYNSVFADSLTIGFSDADALWVVADGVGYDAINIWSDDTSAVAEVEQAIRSLPGLAVSTPAADLAEFAATSLQRARDAIAVVMCMTPNARVALVSVLAERPVTIATADCLLATMTIDPLQPFVVADASGC